MTDNRNLLSVVRDAKGKLVTAYHFDFHYDENLNEIVSTESVTSDDEFRGICHSGMYVGRKKEIDGLKKAILQLKRPSFRNNFLSIYGFGGIGKTSLLEMYRKQADEIGIKVQPRLPRDEIVTESVVSWFSDVFFFRKPENEKSRNENWRNFFDMIEPGTLVLMDTLSHVDMVELNQTLSSLAAGFQKEHKECLIVTATRARPSFRGASFELTGLNVDEIKDLAKIRDWNEEVIELANEIHDQTDGIPLMIECLCEDAELWDKFKNGRLNLARHAHPVSLVLSEMWNSLTESTKQAMKIAALLAVHLAECKASWGRDQCMGLIGSSWDDAFIELKSKSLIKEVDSDIYDIHELVSSYVISRIENKSTLYENIGDYFSSIDNDEVAMRFLVKA